MTKQYMVNIDLINSVLPAASDEPTRYYLCGVNIQDNDGFRHYTATNGHIIFTVKEAIEGEPLENPVTLKLGKAMKFKGTPIGFLSIVDKETAVLKSNVEKCAVDIIDSIYPSYELVIPAEREPAKEYCAFDPEYIKKLNKFIPGANGLRPFMESSSCAALWIKEDDGIVKRAVVMPMRVADIKE